MHGKGGFGRVVRDVLLRNLPNEAQRLAGQIAKEQGSALIKGQDSERDGITYETTFTPPEEVASAARAALKAREQGAKGGTLTGLARARQLAAREPVSLRTIWRMVSFHGRHDAQADGPRREQARKLWGGAAGKAWANAIWNKHKGSVIKSEGGASDALSFGSFMGDECEIPDWLGELVEELQDQEPDLLKGAGHKYIRRVPKAGGKGWRYFYTVTGGQGLGHHSELVKGASFKVKDAGQEGHFHVEEDHGDEVTLRHDESGKTSRISKAALASMLHAEHAEALGAVRERAAANLEQAKKTGTAKQQERAAALVGKYGGKREVASREEINRALTADPVAALKKYAQDMAGQVLSATVTQVEPYTARQRAHVSTKKRSFIVIGPESQGLRVLVADRKRKNPHTYESTYHYDEDIIPWQHLSNQEPSLDSYGSDWREVQNRIQLTRASLAEKPPAHTLGLSAIHAAAEALYNPQEREMLWAPIASPEDAALLASSPVDVGRAMFNVYTHMRDASANISPSYSPGTYHLSIGGMTLEHTNRNEAAVLAELLRTKRPSRASVEEAAQKALNLKAKPFYLSQWA